ncbi:hypothetical protein [Sphingobacterium suaedae]|uniref:Uncharacterized protein n=1 Tax=Sphingobacterium suaedae TaxID=1686402 RepID=A0ABW5KHC5_9SPHI
MQTFGKNNIQGQSLYRASVKDVDDKDGYKIGVAYRLLGDTSTGGGENKHKSNKG